LRRVLGWVAGIALALVALAGAVLLLLDTAPGHRWVATRIGAIRTDTGLRFGVGRIDGSIYSAATLSDVRVYDTQGLVFQAPEARLDWRPFRWFHNRLDIRSLSIARAIVLKPLHTRPTGKTGPILPAFDIRIDRLAIDRVELAPRVTGTARTGRLLATADIRHGRALVHLDALVAGSDALHVAIDAEPDRDRFDIDAHARGRADGLLATMTGIRRRLALDITGDGRWTAWHGTARASADGARLVDLALGNRAGDYALSGVVVPSLLAHGKGQRLTAPQVRVTGRATLAERRLEGRLALRSAALLIDADGAIDLGQSAFRTLKLRANLLQPRALFPNMTAHRFELRAVLDGPFKTARFDYRIDSDRFAFDDTGFENAHASGRGHWSDFPVAVPIRLTAARVTGVGSEAGGILRNLSLAGTLRVTPPFLIGSDLAFRSDKLAGRVNLTLDLDTGHYDIGINGALGRYLIPGLGVVDVQTLLQVVPGPGGHGTRALGHGAAQMIRLDNAFFRSLAGGLPRLTTNLERTPDAWLHFSNLVLTAPTIRITGAGYRRKDGTFHFEGQGTQSTYGPLTIRLDGRIDKPTLDLVFTRPDKTLGLSDVRVHLDPTADGFAAAAQGRSRLGPFDLAGAILLPPGGASSSIRVDRLDVSGTRAAGSLAIVDGGFAGRLALAGGGLSGELLFKMVGAVQRIEGHIDAVAARLAEAITVRRAHLDLAMMLNPAGTTLEATATGGGLRRGGFVLARFAGHAQLTDGVGEVRASIAGTRGRAFAIQTVTQVASDRYTIAATGTLDRRPIRLAAPAVIVREGDGWALQPARIEFAGGSAQLSGRATGQALSIDAGLTSLPLAILDIGYPGLGLGGAASGSVAFAASAGQAPTGRINLTVRGLTRSGLVLSSRPVDVGVAGVLTADRLGVRAIAASGGRTIGRAQALVTPLGAGDLATRVAAAPVTAQLRYDGPAETLWALTGVEIFQLTGPVQIAADMGGRLSDPTIRGLVRANGARIESAVTGTVVTNVQASGRFGGSQLAIDRMSGDAGKGGHVTGSGRFDFSATRGLGIDLALRADKAVIINTDTLGATVTGPLTIRSSGQSGKAGGGVIGGDVVLDRSRYRLGQASTAAAVPQLAIREINLPGGGEEEDVPPQPWRLDLHARAAKALTVSGLGLNSEWSADLRIGGMPDNPAITGRADLVRGDVEFSGREFQLARGVIRFTGDVPANPALDIAADANANGLNATIRVTGVALKPEISFTSVPALPQDELLSRLLFGTSITNLSAPEALQLASAVAALQSGKGGLDPINAVRRVAGLDRLRILPADPQTGQGTSVAAGKYVTRRLYAEIVTDGQGYSATNVEFQVTRWLSLLSSISTLGRTSGNVRVSKDY
jgi:translocation and assembly module TamB